MKTGRVAGKTAASSQKKRNQNILGYSLPGGRNENSAGAGKENRFGADLRQKLIVAK
jgi:hypothetical protein